MARPRKTVTAAPSLIAIPMLSTWAETLGEALGRGVARGINTGLAGLNLPGISDAPRRRGRPPKAFTGVVPAGKQCKVSGCGRPARSKGLCSAHYQAERRRQLARA